MSSTAQDLVALSLSAGEAEAVLLSNALEELGAVCVSIENATEQEATSESKEGMFGEPGMPEPKAVWRQNRIQALFSNQASANSAWAWLQSQPFSKNIQILGINALPENDWVQLTQSQFQPVAITPSFWVVPSWDAVPQDAKTHIVLDPGVAFGTGRHPSTCMCLRWIAKHMQPAATRVLDYGCGSGILAIAAAKFGAASVDAVDVDTQAVQVCRTNVRQNGLTTVQAGTPEMVKDCSYDVVLANILANPLKVLAPLLCNHVKPSGALVLAGILEWQVAALQAAYTEYLDLQVWDQEESWVLMGAYRPKEIDAALACALV